MNDTELLPRSEGIVFATLYIIESLVIVIGNLLTIVAFLTNRQLRKRMFYLLINLAVSDFLVGAVAVPWWVYGMAKWFDLWHYAGNTSTNIARNTASIARGTLSTFLISASLLNLMIISLDRMYATFWPFLYCVITTRAYVRAIALVWILSILLPSANLARHYNLLSLDAFRYIYAVHSSFLLMVIAVSYFSIWVKMKFTQHLPPHQTSLEDRKLTLSLFIVTLVSLVTVLPYRIVFLQKINFESHSSYQMTYYSTILLMYTNSLVNPIIYSLRMAPFRQAVAKLVLRRCTKNRQERSKKDGKGPKQFAETSV